MTLTQPCPFSLPAQTLGLTGAQTTQLLVEPPWRPAVLWDRVTLTCQGSGTAGDTTWYKDGQHWWQEGGDHFTVTESGTYTCERPSTGLSHPVNVSDGASAGTAGGGNADTALRYRQEKSVDSVFFYREETVLGGVYNGTELSLSPLQLNHRGRYRCKAWVNNGVSWGWEESALVTVTVHVPVADATIIFGTLSHQVRAGDNVTLRCMVQVGSAPVTFTWQHNGQQVARGPLLEVRAVRVEHSGTYQCVATNQLGQDGHLAAGVSGALLFLLLLVGVIVAWHWWHRRDARKHQERAHPDPLAPSVEDPQTTYVELQRQPWEPSDICDNLHQKL
ncbi:Fc receptor-like protein 5 [Melospiza georgiana]|uniref:Fc receptor-like protein 5 n=1 Tax=Melospiza georgiana TaxID=44398 RepID=UPI0025AB868C|nr:Fc receptor-like protein 5 [Melospiza georgiana]